MSVLLSFLVLDQTCGQAEAWVNEKLTSAGFRVVPTFDLQIARLAHPDCPCPHHGTNDCNCQMMVLLIYDKHNDPVTLVIHGQDGKTWLSLTSPIETQSHQNLESAVLRVLIPRHSNSSISVEVTHEIRSAD